MLADRTLRNIGIIIIFSLSFFKFGKFILIFLILIFLNLILNKGRIHTNTYFSLIVFFLIFILFTYGLVVGIINGNSLFPVFRDYNYLLYSVTSIVIVNFIRSHLSIVKYLKGIAYGLFQISILIIIVWVLMNIFPPIYNIFLGFKDRTGFAYHFSPVSLTGGRYYYKIFSAFSPLYLFFLPLVLNKNIFSNRKYAITFFVIIILSASFAQFVIIIFYAFVFFIMDYKKYLKVSIKYIVIIVLSGYFFLSSNLGKVIFEKVQNVTSINWDIKLRPDNFTSGMNQRIIQMKVMLDEIQNKPLIGNGLGFESIKYRNLIYKANLLNKLNPNRKVENIEKFGSNGQRINIGMYENQYLDLIMKFGFPFAILMLFFYFVLPIYFNKSIKGNYDNILFSLRIGFYGQLFFMGSNGNLFYSPYSMFIFGLFLSITFFYLHYGKNSCNNC